MKIFERSAIIFGIMTLVMSTVYVFASTVLMSLIVSGLSLVTSILYLIAYGKKDKIKDYFHSKDSILEMPAITAVYLIIAILWVFITIFVSK